MQEEEAGEVEVEEEYTAEQMEQKASEESQALVGLEEEETRRKRSLHCFPSLTSIPIRWKSFRVPKLIPRRNA